MRNSVEHIAHEQLLSWRNNESAELSLELKQRLDQYYTIHRLVINSQSKTAIFKVLAETYRLNKTQFEYIYPLAISFFHSTSKLTKSDFRYILYEKMNKAVQAAWEARELELYILAVEKQAKMVKELWENENISKDDIKQPIFMLVTDPKKFGYDRPSQKEIESEIDAMIDKLGISESEAHKIKRDANVTDVSYEEVKKDGTK
jgi:hypothetical protein